MSNITHDVRNIKSYHIGQHVKIRAILPNPLYYKFIMIRNTMVILLFYNNILVLTLKPVVSLAIDIQGFVFAFAAIVVVVIRLDVTFKSFFQSCHDGHYSVQ